MAQPQTPQGIEPQVRWRLAATPSRNVPAVAGMAIALASMACMIAVYELLSSGVHWGFYGFLVLPVSLPGLILSVLGIQRRGLHRGAGLMPALVGILLNAAILVLGFLFFIALATGNWK